MSRHTSLWWVNRTNPARHRKFRLRKQLPRYLTLDPVKIEKPVHRVQVRCGKKYFQKTSLQKAGTLQPVRGRAAHVTMNHLKVFP